MPEDTSKDSDAADKALAKPRLAKVKRARFLTTFFEAGVPKYETGKHYPITQETLSQVAAGVAERIEVEMDLETHAGESKAASEALDSLFAHTRKAEAAARASGALKD